MAMIFSLFIFWILCLAIASLTDDSSTMGAIIQGACVSLIGSICSIILIWSLHFFYTKNIFAAFERASDY